jgi:hypothetical protein
MIIAIGDSDVVMIGEASHGTHVSDIVLHTGVQFTSTYFGSKF